MKIVINEIIDQLYELVKKTRIEDGIEQLMRECGRLSATYSSALVKEALCWLVLTLGKRLEFTEKKLEELERLKKEARNETK